MALEKSVKNLEGVPETPPTPSKCLLRASRSCPEQLFRPQETPRRLPGDPPGSPGRPREAPKSVPGTSPGASRDPFGQQASILSPFLIPFWPRMVPKWTRIWSFFDEMFNVCLKLFFRRFLSRNNIEKRRINWSKIRSENYEHQKRRILENHALA